MANGDPGKRMNPKTRQKVVDLLKQGLSVSQVVERTHVSESQVLNIKRDIRPETAEELARRLFGGK